MYLDRGGRSEDCLHLFQLRRFYRERHVGKALHGLAPNYITELITVKPLSRYNLRSDGELFL